MLSDIQYQQWNQSRTFKVGADSDEEGLECAIQKSHMH